MTVQELIDQLGQFDPNAPVSGTWENIIREIEVYLTENGTVLIDSDGGDYKARHQGLKCEGCHRTADSITWNGHAVCYHHHNQFRKQQQNMRAED